jgi:hypothetical protein
MGSETAVVHRSGRPPGAKNRSLRSYLPRHHSRAHGDRSPRSHPELPRPTASFSNGRGRTARCGTAWVPIANSMVQRSSWRAWTSFISGARHFSLLCSDTTEHHSARPERLALMNPARPFPRSGPPGPTGLSISRRSGSPRRSRRTERGTHRQPDSCSHWLWERQSTRQQTSPPDAPRPSSPGRARLRLSSTVFHRTSPIGFRKFWRDYGPQRHPSLERFVHARDSSPFQPACRPFLRRWRQDLGVPS